MAEPVVSPTSDIRTSGGALAPLRGPVFRMLWSAWLAANIAMSMHDVAAAWLMTSLTSNPAMVALVSTMSTLPLFLLGLPSGALADILNRRHYFAATQLWAAALAVVLSIVALAGALSAPMLLAMTFLNGITMAMRWPVFSAIVPSVVPRAQLGAALALNGVAMNLPRIVGPMLAGLLLSSLGAQWVFMLNALMSSIAFVVIVRWRYVQKASALPGERFIGAIRVGLQHVMASPRMRVVLLHIALFMLQCAALGALLPLLAKALPEAGAGTFAALLAGSGVGAISMALSMPQVRGRLGRNATVRLGRIAQAVAAVSVAFAPNLWLALPGMFVTGASVMLAANTLSVTAQMALPDWVRARGIAIYQMALMGGTAAGAALWGQVASHSDAHAAILAAALFGIVSALAMQRARLHDGSPDEHLPATPGNQPELGIAIDADDGPVMVTVEYQVRPEQAEAFEAVMRQTRQARLRQGVLSWSLLRDTSVPGRYIEHFVDESWVEHLRRLERFTASDAGLREQRLALHVGESAPRVQRYVSTPLD